MRDRPQKESVGLPILEMKQKQDARRNATA
jgi:hypothetical protein